MPDFLAGVCVGLLLAAMVGRVVTVVASRLSRKIRATARSGSQPKVEEVDQWSFE